MGLDLSWAKERRTELAGALLDNLCMTLGVHALEGEMLGRKLAMSNERQPRELNDQ